MIKVTLKSRDISGKRVAYYLQFAPPLIKNGKPNRKEYLKLHALKTPRTPFERESNLQILKIAKDLEIKRYKEVNGLAIADEMQREAEAQFQRQKGTLSLFIDDVIKNAPKQQRAGLIALNFHLEKCLGDIQIKEINEDTVAKFSKHMKQSDLVGMRGKLLKETSKGLTLAYFKTILKKLFYERLIPRLYEIKFERGVASKGRPFTQEELIILAKRPCDWPQVKNAALFAACTSLRYSDIKELRWSMIKDGYLTKVIKKTGKLFSCPISKQALELLGKRGDPEDLIFVNMPYSPSLQLIKWVSFTDDHITFHDFRYTFATILMHYNVNENIIRSYMHPGVATNTTTSYMIVNHDSMLKAVSLIKLK